MKDARKCYKLGLYGLKVKRRKGRWRMMYVGLVHSSGRTIAQRIIEHERLAFNGLDSDHAKTRKKANRKINRALRKLRSFGISYRWVVLSEADNRKDIPTTAECCFVQKYRTHRSEGGWNHIMPQAKPEGSIFGLSGAAKKRRLARQNREGQRRRRSGPKKHVCHMNNLRCTAKRLKAGLTNTGKKRTYPPSPLIGEYADEVLAGKTDLRLGAWLKEKAR